MKSVLIVVLALIINTGLLNVDSAYAESMNDKTSSHLSLEGDLPEYSKVYDDQRNPFDDANAALALAKKTDRNVLIEIGGNWCTWCHKMDAFLLKNAKKFSVIQ